MRGGLSLAAVCVLLGGSASAMASARCERAATFLELTQFPCATVLVAVVERTGIELSPRLDLRGASMRVTRVLRGAYPDPYRPLKLWGGSGSGPAPTAETFPVGSTWAVVLYPLEGGELEDPFRYRLGGECAGEVAIRFGPEDESGGSLRKQMDRATAESLPRMRSECASGEDRSCYAVACAQEQGLGVRRDLESARAFYRRAYRLRVRIPEP